MNRILMLSVTCLIAATAAAQTKTQTTNKIPQAGYFPAPSGSALLVGGSDDCSTAAASDNITAAMSPVAVTNVGATTGALQGGCPNRNNDVWFYYTPAVTGTAVIATCGGVTADTTLAVWTDGSPAGSCPCTQLACNDDSCGLQSSVTVNITAAVPVFIQLGSFGAATTYSGTFTIVETAGPPPPPGPVNDSCGTPLALPAGPGTFPFDNTASTTGCEGQAESACLFFAQTGIGNDSWFTWTPTSSGTATLSLCGTTVPTGADTKVAIYDGAGCPSTAAIACNDDAGTTACAAGGLNSIVTWPTVCGQTYTIQLGRYPLSTTAISGTFTISELGTPCPTGPSTEKCGNGDVLRIPCPCAPNGTDPHAGCANSLNPAGASLSAAGTVALDNVVLSATGMTGGVAIFIREDGRTPGGVVFGDGVKCGGGSLLRLRAVSFPSGITSVAQFPVPPETITLSARSGTFVGSGVAMQYAAYYRNAAAAFCPPATFNVTDTEEIVW